MPSLYSSAGGFIPDETIIEKKQTQVSNTKQVHDDSWDEPFDNRPAYNREIGVYVPGLGRDWIAESDAKDQLNKDRQDIKKALFI